MNNIISTILRLSKYNIKIVFGSKFAYFILSAVALFIVSSSLLIFGDDEITMKSSYNILVFPAVLTVFYPCCFGIQNDQDNKIIELIFGIPNYRYKVWLFRLFITYVICFVVTICLAVLVDWLIVEVSPIDVTMHVMLFAFFLGMFVFMLSTIIRNGNGTAVISIISYMIVFLTSETIGVSKWNVNLNPYDLPLNKNPEIFATTVEQQHLILAICAILFLLIGLTNTQKREKFI